jgi:hypothetical protein
MAWRKSIMLAAKACAFGAPLAWAGCAEDSVSLRVECAILPEPDDVGCVFDPNGDCLLEGRLNVTAPNAYYQGAVRVTSSLKARESDIPVQAETNGVNITEFEITVLDTAGGRIAFGANLPNPFRIATSGFIPIGSSGVASGDFLPTPYVVRLRENEADDSRALGQVILDVIVRGKTQGGVDVEAGSWRWPVRLFETNLNNPDTCQVFDTAICNFGQDQFVNACLDQSAASD